MQSIAKNSADVIRTIRKFHGLTQGDFVSGFMDAPHSMGTRINQSQVSKIESYEIETSHAFFIWVCNHFDQDITKATLTGLVDFKRKVTPCDKAKVGKFKIKRPWSKGKCHTVRFLYPIIKQVDEKRFCQFLEHHNMDRDYFRILDNVVNTSFINELIEELPVQKLSSDFMNEAYLNETFYGQNNEIQFKKTGAVPLLKKIVSKYAFYNANVASKIEEGNKNEVLIRLEKNPSSIVTDIPNQTKDFIWNYNLSYLESIAKLAGPGNQFQILENKINDSALIRVSS